MDLLKNKEIFKNPPIKEALIDIGYKDLGPEALPLIENVYPNFSKHFSVKKTLRTFQHIVKLEENNLTTENQNLTMGFQFWAADNSELITCRRDGFSYNKLKPYISWEDSLKKLITNWKAFSEKLNIEYVNKLAVRNVNIIQIPGETFDLEDYFYLNPTLPDQITSTVNDFFTRIVLDFPDRNAKCIITLANQPSPILGHNMILLDIEAYKVFEKPIPKNSIHETLEYLNNDVKDLVFFSTIKEKTKKLFR